MNRLALLNPPSASNIPEYDKVPRWQPAQPKVPMKLVLYSNLIKSGIRIRCCNKISLTWHSFGEDTRQFRLKSQLSSNCRYVKHNE